MLLLDDAVELVLEFVASPALDDTLLLTFEDFLLRLLGGDVDDDFFFSFSLGLLLLLPSWWPELLFAGFAMAAAMMGDDL